MHSWLCKIYASFWNFSFIFHFASKQEEKKLVRATYELFPIEELRNKFRFRFLVRSKEHEKKKNQLLDYIKL